MMADQDQTKSRNLSFEPFFSAQPSRAEQNPAILLEQFRGRKDVLLVDDDPVNRLVGLGILDFPGIKVKTAVDGLDAIELLNRHHFDLILMDIHMPRMDGIEAVRHIRKMPQGFGLPIIALTADYRFENTEYAISLNMNDCLMKPIDPDILYQKALQWLQISS